MKQTLTGARILVTRPVGQAENLCRLIEQQGAKAIHIATLAIEGITPKPLALSRSLASDWLIFTSTNAVNFALQTLDGKMSVCETRRIAAVGQATANALKQAGLTVDCVPVQDFSSEGLLAMPELQQVTGKQCTIVRGLGGREKIAETLRSRAAEVGYLEVYRRFQPETDTQELTSLLSLHQLQATTITSTEALQNLLSLLDSENLIRIKAIPLIVVSERIAHTAKELGFKQIAVSPQPTDAAILETLTTLLDGDNSGRSN